MQEIEIQHIKQGCGFTARPATITLAGVKFENGKIAYLNTDGAICAGDDEQSVVKALKTEAGTVDVSVVQKES